MSTRDVLVLAEVQRDALADISLELLAAARSVAAAGGGEVIALVLSRDGSRFAPALGAADRIVLVDAAELDSYAPAPYLAALEEVVAAEQPRAVLVGSTSIGWDLAPMLAARQGAPLLTGCKAIDAAGDRLTVTSSFYGGKMLAQSRVDVSPAILMVLPGAFRPDGRQGKARVETRPLAAALAADAVQFDEWILPDSTDVDITQQDLLVAAGRGIQQQNNLELAEDLAGALGGAVCASRPVVDQGWLPATRQVGKSGMTVRPKVYFALGISGAPEHQEGMKSADLIIAVNTDPKAPIFDVAHYGAEMDMIELLPPLVEAIQAKKG